MKNPGLIDIIRVQIIGGQEAISSGQDIERSLAGTITQAYHRACSCRLFYSNLAGIYADSLKIAE